MNKIFNDLNFGNIPKIQTILVPTVPITESIINRFRNRVKDEINGIFTQIVLILASKGFISLVIKV